jgi:hypothetical protein
MHKNAHEENEKKKSPEKRKRSHATIPSHPQIKNATKQTQNRPKYE